jgi:hypothetical protein
MCDLSKLQAAADKMHAELLAQVDRLMDAEANTKAGDDLERIAGLVSNYEEARWPLHDDNCPDAVLDANGWTAPTR